jgi:hypothetical protein
MLNRQPCKKVYIKFNTKQNKYDKNHVQGIYISSNESICLFLNEHLGIDKIISRGVYQYENTNNARNMLGVSDFSSIFRISLSSLKPKKYTKHLLDKFLNNSNISNYEYDIAHVRTGDKNMNSNATKLSNNIRTNWESNVSKLHLLSCIVNKTSHPLVIMSDSKIVKQLVHTYWKNVIVSDGNAIHMGMHLSPTKKDQDSLILDWMLLRYARHSFTVDSSAFSSTVRGVSGDMPHILHC